MLKSILSLALAVLGAIIFMKILGFIWIIAFGIIKLGIVVLVAVPLYFFIRNKMLK